jgi:hypothetical protein
MSLITTLKSPSTFFALSKIAMVAFAISIAAYSGQAPGRSKAEPAIETLAEFPHGTFLENLVIDPSSAVIMTDYTGLRLLRQVIGPDGGTDGLPAPVATFATLDVHPAGIARLGDGYLVSAHGKSFLAGPAFVETQLLLVLDASGKEIRRIAASKARFLNGIAVSADGLVLIADSAAGIIWRFDPDANALTEWLKAPLLSPDPTAPGRPGVNGLKFHDGKLYASNSSRGAICTVSITRQGRARGPCKPYAQTGPVDDFTFDSAGAIVAATHGSTLIRVGRDRKIVPILDKGCDSCTAVVLAPDSNDYLVLTTGNLLEQGSEPARLLRVRSRNAPQR